jgi:hypothetical protein
MKQVTTCNRYNRYNCRAAFLSELSLSAERLICCYLVYRVGREVVVQVNTNTMVFLSLSLLQLCRAQVPLYVIAHTAVNKQQQKVNSIVMLSVYNKTQGVILLQQMSNWLHPQHASKQKWLQHYTAYHTIAQCTAVSTLTRHHNSSAVPNEHI